MATAAEAFLEAPPGKSAAEMFLEEGGAPAPLTTLRGGSNPTEPSFLSLVKENYVTPYVELPKLESSPADAPLTKAAVGLGNVAISAAEGLESPLGVSLLAASALPVVGKLIGRTAAAAFGVKSTLSGFKEAAQAWQEGDPEKTGRAIGELLLGGLMVRGSVASPKVAAMAEATKVLSESAKTAETVTAEAKSVAAEPSTLVTIPGQKPGELPSVESPSTVSPSDVTKPGPGAASPADFTPPQPFLTGIKNAVVDQERTARGLEPLMDAARQSNPASWDKAMALIDEMPGVQDSLIRVLNSGEKVPGIEPVVQEALLLHRRIDLRNEFEKTARDLVEAVEQGDPARVEQTRFAHARFEDMLDELESASKKSGTELGRGLQFRRQMAMQDFSLAGMISEARAARGGRRLSDTELAEVERLHNQLIRLQEEFDAYRNKQKTELDVEVAAGKAKPPPSGEPPLDETALDKLAEVKQRQKKFKEANQEAQDKIERTPFENALNAFVKWRRFSVLSGARSLAKLASYSLQKVIGTPIEEGLQGAIAHLPGIKEIAEKSSTTGTSLSHELDAFKEGMTTGIDDAVQTFRTGNSKLDALYGEKLQMDPEWTGFFGRLHGAEKSPLKRIAFERSLAQRTEWAAKNGIDVTDPAVQMRLGTEAYADSLVEVLMNPNEVAANVNSFLGRLGVRLGVPGKIAETTGRVLMPIQRVPLNFVARTWDYIAGLELGSIKAARALLSEKGIEQLKPEEANLIMKQLARGSIGTAAVLTGYLLPENFGGSYRPGVPREEDDVRALSVRFGEHDIPAYLVHNPLVYAMQFGATLRRVSDSKLRKKDEDEQGLPPAVMAAMFGLAEETPYVREMLELTKFGEERTAGPAAGKLLKSLTVPLGVQWVAEQMDKQQPFSPGEEPVPRAPESILQHVETGIPVLRENVPEKLEKPKRKR